ncbi:MAG: NERD domain-containing protein [Rhodocyclaceae bacterium]|nr:NERD domain-containing protein [Rhodocyclaceae bacterium]
MTVGERLFASRLLTKLENDYHCWFNVPIGPKQLRPDFVVLHPGRGILVLEVKDWKLDTLRNIDRQTVELLTERGIRHDANPLEQARSYALAITSLLERDPFLVEQEEGRYKGHLLFPWGYGVVLTNISRRQFVEHRIDQAIPPDKVICSDEMKESVDAEAFQQRLWGMFNYHFGKALSLSRIDRIRWHLFPEIRVEQGALFSSSTPVEAGPQAEVAETIPDLVRVMDAEQEKFARDLGDGHRLIHGVAGSGKTMILAYRCLHLARSGLDKPILVLCFNKTLAGRLRSLLQQRGVGDNVHIRHFHGWCKDMCDLYQLDLSAVGGGGEKTFDLQVKAVITGVDSGRVPKAQYSAILIDEGHDFEPDWFKLVVQMLDPATDSLLLAYDDVQGIYKRNKPKSWASVGIKVPGRRSTIFKVNYRNTAEALDLAFRFVGEYLDESSATEDIPVVRPASGLRHGPRPALKRFRNFEEETSAVAAWLKKRAKEGAPLSCMAVLCRYNNQVTSIRAALEKGGVAVADADATNAKDGVQIMTMHSSKGLEFQCVVIPDLGAMPCARVPEAEEARVLYVAMTRATQELLLTAHSESRFTKKLAGEVESIAEVA